MCGRFADLSRDDIVAWFGVDQIHGWREPSRNVSPTQPVWVVADRRDGPDQPAARKLRLARWGLVPNWARAVQPRPLINARAETLTQKPSFRAGAARRRVIVPAAGYYEWVTAGGVKTPYFLHRDDGAPLGFAGVCDWWRVPEGADVAGAEDGWLCSVAIITRPAADAIGHIHDRMPVVVPEALADAWLDPGLTRLDQVDELLEAMPDPALVRFPGQLNSSAISSRTGAEPRVDSEMASRARIVPLS